MARRGSRGRSGGSSSRGRSSRGRSRSSAKKSSRKAPSRSRSKPKSRGKPATRGRATKKASRTKTTRSALARRTKPRTSKAAPRRVSRIAVRRVTKTVSPRRINVVRRPIIKPRQIFRPTFPTPIKRPNPLSNLFRYTYQDPKDVKRKCIRCNRSPCPCNPAIGINRPKRPDIPRISQPSYIWDQYGSSDLMRVPSQPRALAPKPKRISAFGGLGANPWNPIEGIAGLFGMNQQEQPASRYMPPEAADIVPRPTYQAMAQPEDQRGSMLYSSQGFNQQLTQQGKQFSTQNELAKLKNNPWVLYAGLGIAALIILKITMGFLSGGRASQGAPSGGFIIRT